MKEKGTRESRDGSVNGMTKGGEKGDFTYFGARGETVILRNKKRDSKGGIGRNGSDRKCRFRLHKICDMLGKERIENRRRK